MRTLVIGLDGASWNVLDPLLADGAMPTLSALRERGAAGSLSSTLPFYTGPAWASYATGTTPAAHGVWDFMMVRDGDLMTVAHERDLRRRTLWELVAGRGGRSVVINLVLDMEEQPGVTVVNSWLTDRDDQRLYPEAARERYAAELAGYQSYPTTFDDPLDVHLADLQRLEESHMALARRLIVEEEWEHFYVLFSSPDWIGHHSGGAFERGDEAARAAFATLYRQLDDAIAELMRLAPDATVVVLSDHGQCEERHVVRVNQILRELGHVKLRRERPTDANAAAGSGTRATVRVPSSFNRIKKHRFVRPIAKPAASLAKRLLSRGGVELLTPGKGDEVDRMLSTAFTPTVASFGVYLRGDAAERVDEVREALLAPRLPDGRPAIEGVWTVEELYGTQAPGGPTLLFSPALNVIPSIHVRTPVIDGSPRPGRGCHQREGMLVIAGPDVVASELIGATIYDIAPTLLWLMGTPVPECDGRVLFEAFEPELADRVPLVDAPAATVERQAVEAGDDAEVVRRLQALGYL